MTFQQATTILKNKYFATVKSTGRGTVRVSYRIPEMSEKNYDWDCTKEEMIEMVEIDEADEKITDAIFTGEKPCLTKEEIDLLVRYRSYEREDLE